MLGEVIPQTGMTTPNPREGWTITNVNVYMFGLLNLKRGREDKDDRLKEPIVFHIMFWGGKVFKDVQ